jgi:hypothetical protein
MTPKKKTELQELIEELQMLYLERMELEEQIEAIRDRDELPKLKRRFERKYFKYNNGYNSEDRWWLYSHCKEVKGLRNFIVDKFETDIRGESTFQLSAEEFSTTGFQKQITKREYNTALRKFKAKLNNL